MDSLIESSPTAHRVDLRPGKLAVAVLALLAAACFRSPVVERLVLEFAADQCTATIVTELETHSDSDERYADPGVRDYQNRVERGEDPWRDDIRALRPARERSVLERADGQLTRIERQLTIDDLDRLPRLFSGDAVRASFLVDDGRHHLTLSTVGTLAEGHESDQVANARSEVLRLTRAYLEATHAVFKRAMDVPERRIALIGAAFSALLSDADESVVDELLTTSSDDEKRALEGYRNAGDALVELLYTHAGEDRSSPTLEHLSRRVFFPLRASLEVIVDGEVVEARGFRRIDDSGRRFDVPEVSFLHTLIAIAGDIVAPLPLPELIAHEIQSEQDDKAVDVPLADIVARELVANPIPPDLEARFDQELRAAPDYYLAWIPTARKAP